MGVYQGSPFPLKRVGVCSTCPSPTAAPQTIEGRKVNQWLPGVVRYTFEVTAEEKFLQGAGADLTFCRTCAAKVDDTDFSHLEDLIWRGWQRSAKVAQLSKEEWERRIQQYRGFRLVKFKGPHRRINAEWEWEEFERETSNAS